MNRLDPLIPNDPNDPTAPPQMPCKTALLRPCFAVPKQKRKGHHHFCWGPICYTYNMIRQVFLPPLWKNDRPTGSQGFLFEGVANFLTKGGKKTPLNMIRLYGCVVPKGNPAFELSPKRKKLVLVSTTVCMVSQRVPLFRVSKGNPKDHLPCGSKHLHCDPSAGDPLRLRHRLLLLLADGAEGTAEFVVRFLGSLPELLDSKTTFREDHSW